MLVSQVYMWLQGGSQPVVDSLWSLVEGPTTRFPVDFIF